MVRTLLRVVSVCTLAAAVCAQWAAQLADTLASGADKATVAQLVAEGGGISITSCGGPGHAFAIDHMWAQSDALAVVVKGSLKHELRAGMLHAHLELQRPANLSIAQHLKYVTATAFSRARKFVQPLCEHLGRDAGCTLPAGEQELRFAFRSLPEMVFVGSYSLELHATDDAGQPIACIRGSFTVPEGKSRGMLRKLETEGCPRLIMENLWAIPEIHEPREECENKRWELAFNMNADVDFYVWGAWYADDCGGPWDTLTLSRRVNGLYGPCLSEGTGGCSHLACTQAACRKCDGCEDWRCEPTDGYSDCDTNEEYSIHKDELGSKCYEGAPILYAKGPEGEVSSATTTWLSWPVLLFLGLILAP